MQKAKAHINNIRVVNCIWCLCGMLAGVTLPLFLTYCFATQGTSSGDAYSKPFGIDTFGSPAIYIPQSVIQMKSNKPLSVDSESFITRDIDATSIRQKHTGTYYSQSGEDQYAEQHYFHGRKNGVYLEVGGLDGVSYSNSQDNLQFY